MFEFLAIAPELGEGLTGGASGEEARTVLQALAEAASESAPITPGEGALTMSLVLFKVTFIAFSIRPCKHTEAMH